MLDDGNRVLSNYKDYRGYIETKHHLQHKGVLAHAVVPKHVVPQPSSWLCYSAVLQSAPSVAPPDVCFVAKDHDLGPTRQGCDACN